MGTKRMRDAASIETQLLRQKRFSGFTCCSRRVFLCVHGLFVDEEHGVMLL